LSSTTQEEIRREEERVWPEKELFFGSGVDQGSERKCECVSEKTKKKKTKQRMSCKAKQKRKNELHLGIPLQTTTTPFTNRVVEG
jgi:hypothetical protein